MVLTTGQYAADLVGGVHASHDEQMHPVNSEGSIIAQNIFVAGLLSHRGCGGEVAGIVTGYRAGMLAAAKEVCFANG